MDYISEVKKILTKLVSFDTVSRNSNMPCIMWVKHYLDELGVEAELVPNEDGTKANLWATIGPQDVPGYILSGHTDVVPVDGQPWSTDPFVVTERDGLLFGRGTADMKGFLAVCLAMVPYMLKADLKQPIHLAFSYDEEVGCLGVRSLLERLKSLPVTPLGCFVGEPSEMKTIVGQKSSVRLWVDVVGREAHSSLVPMGVNAVEWAARVVTRVREYEEKLEDSGPRDDCYDVHHTTMQVGVFNGGAVPNVVPKDARFTFEVRAIGEDNPLEIAQSIADWAKNTLEPKMKRIAPEAGFHFEQTTDVPGFDIDLDDALVLLSRQLSGEDGIAKVSYATEAGLFTRTVGVPTVVIGPGSIEQAHKVDEFIAVSELQKCATFLENLIGECRG